MVVLKTDGYYYKTVTDSRKPPNTLNCPRHIDEGLFYLANGYKETPRVPYEAVRLFSSSPVGNILVRQSDERQGGTKNIEIKLTTDFHVIITTNVWNLPLDITQTLFPNSSKHYLLTMMNALRDSHFILSSKIFFPFT